MFQIQLPNYTIRAGHRSDFKEVVRVEGNQPYIVLITIDYFDGEPPDNYAIDLPSEEAMERHVVNLLVEMREEFDDEQNT
jgi:hypothetical protein